MAAKRTKKQQWQYGDVTLNEQYKVAIEHQKSVYYIHMHAQNIGLAGGNPKTVTDKELQDMYQQRVGAAERASRRRFKKLFKKQIKGLNEDEIKDLFLSFGSGPGFTIEQQITEMALNMIKFDREKLMKYQENITKVDKNITTLISSRTGGLENNKETIKEFFESIEQGVNMITNLDHEVVRAFFARITESNDYYYGQGKPFMDFKYNNSDLSTMAEKQKSVIRYLSKLLEDGFRPDGKVISIEPIDLIETDPIFKYLWKLKNQLGNVTLSQHSFQQCKKLLSEIFPQVITEEVTAMSTTAKQGFQEVGQAVAKEVKGKALGEKFRIKVQSEYDEKDFFGTTSLGKKDIALGPIALTRTRKLTDKGTIKFGLEIGISAKMYATLPFEDFSSGKRANPIELGSGGNVHELLNNIFRSDGEREKYLTLNLLSQESKVFPSANQALNLLALKRQINRLLVTRGGESDFNQILLVNGRIYTTAEIVDLILKSKDLKYSRSMLQNRRGSDQVAAISFSGRSDAINKNRENYSEGIIKRLQEVNKALNGIKVTGVLRLSALDRALKKTRSV